VGVVRYSVCRSKKKWGDDENEEEEEEGKLYERTFFSVQFYYY
jgi:hypothetical protein